MRKKSIQKLILFIFLYNFSVSQEVKDYNDIINKYSISNPDVASFERYSFNDVDYYNGRVKVSIPIYSIKTGNINYPVNLNYFSGGIKVNQYASDVGLGWSLSSSVITRTINHFNDFDNLGSLILDPEFSTYSQDDKNAHSSAWTENGYTGNIGYMLQNQIGAVENNDRKNVDFLPDIYNVYIPEYNTKFIFNTYSSTKELQPKGTSIGCNIAKIRIDTKRGYYNVFNTSVWEPVFNIISKDVLSITITTNKGIRYTFGDCDYSFTQNLNTYTPHPSSAQVSAWHISKIVDLNTGKEINFIYDTTSSNPNHLVNASTRIDGVDLTLAQREYEIIKNPANNNLTACDYWIPNFDIESYKCNLSIRVDVVKNRLKQINFEDGKIIFNYNNAGISGAAMTSRNDIYNGDFVSQIYVKDLKNNIINSYNFNYSYFNSDYNLGEFNPDGFQNDKRYNRLKLISFQELGKSPYEFIYEENSKLPPINSFSVDFTGHFNNSPDISSIQQLQNIQPNPKLYYTPNKFDKSLLPFQINNYTSHVISGYFNREANENSKSWSLKKIIFPTGGSAEYIYESNKFLIDNTEIKGGGIRISQQKIDDGNGNTRTLNYNYLNTNGLSSGNLISMPYFGFPTKKFFNTMLDFSTCPPTYMGINGGSLSAISTTEFKIIEKSRLNSDLTSNAYVEYDRVIEEETGHGKKEMIFTSSNTGNDFKNRVCVGYPGINSSLTNDTCFYEFIIANSAIASHIFRDKNYKRGKILEKNIFDDSNNLTMKTKFTYTETSFTGGINCYQTFTRPVHTVSDNNLRSMFVAMKFYDIANYLPTSEENTLFYSNGSTVFQKLNYEYNNKGIINFKEQVTSDGGLYSERYYYTSDVNTSLTSLPGEAMSLDENTMYRSLAFCENQIGEPIQINYFKNQDQISYLRKTYKTFNPLPSIFPCTNIISFEKLKTAKGDNTLNNDVTINLYDSKFNVNQYTINENKIISQIWGYNKTQPVAKLENITYASIPSNLITTIQTATDSATSTEAQILTALNALRSSTDPNMQKAMITTYSYKPLVGVTTVTDPKGDTQYYTYDSFGRLQYVKDKDGNIVNENEYHYKP